MEALRAVSNRPLYIRLLTAGLPGLEIAGSLKVPEYVLAGVDSPALTKKLSPRVETANECVAPAGIRAGARRRGTEVQAQDNEARPSVPGKR